MRSYNTSEPGCTSALRQPNERHCMPAAEVMLAAYSSFPQPRSMISFFTRAAASSRTSRAPSTGMCLGSASGQSSFSRPARQMHHFINQHCGSSSRACNCALELSAGGPEVAGVVCADTASRTDLMNFATLCGVTA